jgi:polyhydroxybutyrate depolymerase
VGIGALLFALLGSMFLLASAFIGAVVYRFVHPLKPVKRNEQDQPDAGFSVHSLISGGARRVYGLYVPQGIDLERPLSLVISLAGFGMNPAFQRYVSRWDELADRSRFLVAYPQGCGFPLRFNAGPVYNLPVADDVQLIHDLIVEIGRFFEVDRQRIYVNGMSAGAHMTERIACELADEVAAVGMAAGCYLELPGGCQPRRAMPLIAFQGTVDPTGAYRGRRERSKVLLGLMKLVGLAPGSVVEIPAFEDWAAVWAERNGCDLAAAQWEVEGEARCLRYPDRVNHGDVEIYVIEGGGHTWPGGSPTFIGKTSRAINASHKMWAFFESHPLCDSDPSRSGGFMH